MNGNVEINPAIANPRSNFGLLLPLASLLSFLLRDVSLASFLHLRLLS